MSHSIRVLALVSSALLASAAHAQLALQLTNTSSSNYSYVRIADSAALEPQQFTLELRFKPTDIGYGNTTDGLGAALLSKPMEGSGGSYLVSWHLGWVPSSAQVLAVVTHAFGSQGAFLYSNATVPIGSSAHVALSFDGATLRLYVDGQLDSTAAFGYSGVAYGAQDVLIGANNFASNYLRRFTGVIDDVRIWDHARDASAIEMLRACRLSGAEGGLIAYYSFNPPSTADITGHGHHGTIEGPTATYVGEPLALFPCGSPSQSYCTAGTSTNGCTPTMSASGVASVAQSSGFTLSATALEGQKLGLVFYGLNGPVSSPWAPGSTSVLCVKSPVQRTTVMSSGGTAGACNGVLAIDFLAYLAANPGASGNPFSAGEAVRAQAWYRDPPAPGTTNLSNGLCFVTAP